MEILNILFGPLEKFGEVLACFQIWKIIECEGAQEPEGCG